MKGIKGYKVFNPDWTCRGYKFEVGKTYEEEVVPKCCSSGFHFCLNLADCFSYYDFNPNNKVAEVLAIGDIDKNDEDTKCCTNRIKIIREMSWEEVLKLCNTGNHNTGKGNTGSRNTGNYNAGTTNSGSKNTGSYNTGNWNTGNWNTGDDNTGDCNAGDWNTGDNNKGNRNTGDNNIGYRNTGNGNEGNWNTGNWNKGNYNTGCFNTIEQKIMLFNKQSNMTYEDWNYSEAEHILSELDEIITNVTTGEYLKVLDIRECRQKWWDNLSEEKKNIIKSIPNFDAEIFYECTGIVCE